MARVSKSDRDQAASIIKTRINAQLTELKDTVVAPVREEAMAKIDKKLGLRAACEQLQELEKEVSDLQRKIAKAINTCSRYELKSTVEGFLARQAESEIGRKLEKSKDGRRYLDLQKRLHVVDDNIFLATTHEALVEIIGEMTN